MAKKISELTAGTITSSDWVPAQRGTSNFRLNLQTAINSTIAIQRGSTIQPYNSQLTQIVGLTGPGVATKIGSTWSITSTSSGGNGNADSGKLAKYSSGGLFVAEAFNGNAYITVGEEGVSGGIITIVDIAGRVANINATTLTADREYELPDESGNFIIGTKSTGGNGASDNAKLVIFDSSGSIAAQSYSARASANIGSAFGFDGVVNIINISGFQGGIRTTNLTSNRQYQLPDEDGTLLTDDEVTISGEPDKILKTDNDGIVTIGGAIFKGGSFDGQVVAGSLTATRVYTLPNETGTFALGTKSTGGNGAADDGKIATFLSDGSLGANILRASELQATVTGDIGVLRIVDDINGYNTQITSEPLSGSHLITFPDKDGTVCLTEDPGHIGSVTPGAADFTAVSTSGNVQIGSNGSPFSILEWGIGTLSGGQAAIGIENLGAGNACCIVTPRTAGIGVLMANQDFSGSQLDVKSYDPSDGSTVSSDTRSFSYILIDIAT